MPPPPFSLHWRMLRVLHHLLMVLDWVMCRGLEDLRARRDALPRGHVRRARMARRMGRLARLRRLAADPALLEDAAFRGMAAEVARVRDDAGRRAMPRRRIHPTPLARLCGGAAFRPVAAAEGGRCTGMMAAA